MKEDFGIRKGILGEDFLPFNYMDLVLLDAMINKYNFLVLKREGEVQSRPDDGYNK